MIKVINVSNGDSKYPGNFTPKELKIIKYNSKGRILNLFSGRSYFGNIRVDYACEEANIKSDVFSFLENTQQIFKTIIIDAPYNRKFADKYQKLNNTPEQFIIFTHAERTTYFWSLIKKLKPIRIILKSFNYYIPEGFILDKGYLCYAGGYRKPTLLLILSKGGEE